MISLSQTQGVLDTLDPDLMKHMVSRRAAVGGMSATAVAVAAASLPLGLGLFARKAYAQGSLPQPIIDVLNFALTLEYLEAEFYELGVPEVVPPEDCEIMLQILKHEKAHVELLKGVLGSAAIAKPTFDFTAGGMFPNVFSNYQTFLVLAQGFEDTGVRAYKGQAAALISSDAILTTALRIHSVEARHAAIVRTIRGLKGWITRNQNDVPALNAVYAGEENTVQAGVDTTMFANVDAATEAFDEPLTRAEVLAIAAPFIVST